MKSKFFGLGLLVMAFMLFPMISAATTLNTPLASTNHTGTLSFNCTTDLANTLNASIVYNASGGAATTILATVVNTSASQTEFVNAAVDISGLTDTATYNFSCLADDGASPEYATGLTGITIDNTDPVVSLFVDLSGTSQSYGRGVDYSCTTTDALDSGPTETFSVAHPSGDTTSTTSLTLQSVKLFFDDTDYAGDYVFTCTSTDYTGNSDSDAATVTVDSAGKAHVVGGSSGDGSNTWVWVVLGLVVVWLVSNAKKK